MMIDWRNGASPGRAVASGAGVIGRLVSVGVHGLLFVVFLVVSRVPETLVEEFESPHLMISLAAPAAPAPREAPAPPAPAPRLAARPPLPQASVPINPTMPAADISQMIPVASEADFAGLGVTSLPDAPALSAAPRSTAPAEPVTRAEGDGPGGNGQAAGGEVTAPIFDAAYLNNPRPSYPDAAVRRGISGTVLLRVLVSVDGQPQSVTLERSSGSKLLDEAALDTVRRTWRFAPATRGGAPVSATVLVPIVFALQAR